MIIFINSTSIQINKIVEISRSFFKDTRYACRMPCQLLLGIPRSGNFHFFLSVANWCDRNIIIKARVKLYWSIVGGVEPIQMDVIRSHNITIIWFHFSFLLVYHLFKTKHSRCSLTFLNVNIIFSHNLRFHFGVMPAKMKRNLDIDSKNCEWACFRCIKIRRIVSGARSHKPKMKEKTRRRKKTIWQREMVENEMSSNQSRQASL